MQRVNAERKAAGLPVGRPPGTPNRLTNVARGAVLEVFKDMGGVKGMLEWARENPSSFYGAFLKLIPKELSDNDRGAGITVVVQGSAQLRKGGVTIEAGAPFDDPIPFGQPD